MFGLLVLPLLFNLLFVPFGDHELPVLRPSRVLLVTAHPDDEAMFFGPSVLRLSEHAEVFALVISSGDLGKIRYNEAYRSFDVLGIPNENIAVLDHPALQDGFENEWRSDLVAGIIHDYVLRFGITDIVTFDIRGISKHPNHAATCEGALTFFAAYQPPKAGIGLQSQPDGVRLWILESSTVMRKYSGILAPLSTSIILVFQRGLGRALDAAGFPVESSPRRLTFISTPKEYWRTLSAMRQHKSQLVWFRWLYVLFSRYMWVNDLVEMKVERPVRNI